MADFFLKIAGHTGFVRSLFESTPVYLKNYIVDEPGEFTVTVTREDLEAQQRLLLEEALEEGLRVRTFPDPFLERACIQRYFADYLFTKDILLFHGSTVAVDGKAYLFTANCGVGKSTHTRLWRERFGERAVMVNDDKPFLELRADGVFAHGAPWSGKHGLDTNICVPLQGICVLERGGEDAIWPADLDAIRPMLEKQSHHHPEDSDGTRLRMMTECLLNQVSLWQMRCTKQPSAVEISWKAMSGSQ